MTAPVPLEPIPDAATCCARAFESASYFIPARIVAQHLYSTRRLHPGGNLYPTPPLSVSLAASIKCIPLPSLHSGRTPSRSSCRYAGVNNLALYRVGMDGRIEACYADLYRP